MSNSQLSTGELWPNRLFISHPTLSVGNDSHHFRESEVLYRDVCMLIHV